MRIDLSPFTLVGETTRAGLLATPLRDRFGIPLRLVFYTPEELLSIVARGIAGVRGLPRGLGGGLCLGELAAQRVELLALTGEFPVRVPRSRRKQ